MFEWPAGGAELFGWYLGMFWRTQVPVTNAACCSIFIKVARHHYMAPVTSQRPDAEEMAVRQLAVQYLLQRMSHQLFDLVFFLTEHSFLGGILKWRLQWAKNHPVKVKDDSNLTWEMETNQIRNSNFTFALWGCDWAQTHLLIFSHHFIWCLSSTQQ